MDRKDALAWHAQPAADVLRHLAAEVAGLAPAEAARRLAADGPNRLPRPPRPGLAVRLARQFNNLLILVLLASAAASLALGHPVDAAVILAVVLLNAIIGFFQEGRAERALEAISFLLDPRASVLRDGTRASIPAEAIVRGDIVLLEPGDRVPADLRLVEARALSIEEAALTGESVPVAKHTAPARPGAPLAERECMAYSGTLVAAGFGRGVVVATAAASELGRISTMLGEVQTLQTPLIRAMDALARRLTAVILAVCALAFAFAVWARGYGTDEAFMAMVGLAVAAIPEGLPAVLTITLALGVQRMAARQAIIRRLPAAETLGAASVVCSDKTGTLTRNEMMVQALVSAGAEARIDGQGYAPRGEFHIGDARIDPRADPVLEELLHAFVLCNDATLGEIDGTWRPQGDPMEGALLAAAMKAGLDPQAIRAGLPRHDAIPFDSAHRFMATLHPMAAGPPLVVVKGAPERVLAMCDAERHSAADRPLDVAAWHARAETLAARGQRVLAFATTRAAPGGGGLDHGDVTAGLVLLGLAGLIDPPRAEAAAAVRECRAAGIRVVMITGDHIATAREIARQLGIAEAPVALEGSALETMDEPALRSAARRTDVFARAAPEHKLRLVHALQAEGAVVAMTGDGVNDAPALKRADIGVAMGRNGTEAAKQAADMVLADDNFATIVAAVREGRTVYDNIVKVIGWTLPTNGGEALIILAAIVLGLALPVTAVQILWINMVTAVALGLTLAFEPTEPGAMRRPPRAADQPILDPALLWRVGFVSLLFVGAAFAVFAWSTARGDPVELARTLVVNTVVVLEIVYLFSVRFVHGTSLTARGVLGTPAVLAGVGVTVLAQLAFTYAPPLQAVFATRSVTLADGAVVLAAGAALLLLLELEKIARGRLFRPAAPKGDAA